MNFKTEDLRIQSIDDVIPPAQLHEEFPISTAAAKLTYETRLAIHQLLHGQDDRVLAIVGPCSVHDPKAAVEYAAGLASLVKELSEQLIIVMRVYFEKPRTTVGWKGLINDPDLDGSFNINKGLRCARKLLLDLNDMGVPAGSEFLDIVTPQYFTDLITWGAIGARTTESQVHRELASGLSCPVGFKNGTNGDIQVALDAIRAARHPHHFLSFTMAAHSAIFFTSGNEDTHLILRGGKQPNFDAANIDAAGCALAGAGLSDRLMIDFSHANSNKQHERQRDVCRDVAGQIAGGEDRIMGVMIESHLNAGRQNVTPGKPLVYGQSITDACIGWEDTKEMLNELADSVKQRRVTASKARAAS
ncbi:MAG: 3-deoxy-7-phosphoheptulonate synthase [Gammaproteobacteria bacterium]|jgi:3-deoxy-7-phosphoheptulonate synthase|nr:3-deoxy-7-phosphoheptulonate synthase [Gammaproteobacteria bacterium]